MYTFIWFSLFLTHDVLYRCLSSDIEILQWTSGNCIGRASYRPQREQDQVQQPGALSLKISYKAQTSLVSLRRVGGGYSANIKNRRRRLLRNSSQTQRMSTSQTSSPLTTDEPVQRSAISNRGVQAHSRLRRRALHRHGHRASRNHVASELSSLRAETLTSELLPYLNEHSAREWCDS